MSRQNRASQPAGTLVSISQVAKQTPYSTVFLRGLARTGKITAVKLGRDWLTTEESVLAYLRTQQVRYERKLEALKTAQRSLV